MNFALKSAAVHDCLVAVHLYVQQTFISVLAVTQECCQQGLHSSTEQQGLHFALNSAAVDESVVTVNLYVQQTFIGVIAVTQGCCQQGFAQQHRATRLAFCHKECSHASLIGHCTPVCPANLQGCNCSKNKAAVSRVFCAAVQNKVAAVLCHCI